MNDTPSLNRTLKFDSSFSEESLTRYSVSSFIFFGLSLVCLLVMLTVTHFNDIEKVLLISFLMPLFFIFALLGLYARLNLRELKDHNKSLAVEAKRLARIVSQTYGISLSLDEAQILMCGNWLPLNLDGRRAYVYLSFLTDGTDARLVYTDSDRELKRLDEVVLPVIAGPATVTKKMAAPRKPRTVKTTTSVNS
jgi:hypothetical protein